MRVNMRLRQQWERKACVEMNSWTVEQRGIKESSKSQNEGRHPEGCTTWRKENKKEEKKKKILFEDRRIEGTTNVREVFG